MKLSLRRRVPAGSSRGGQFAPGALGSPTYLAQAGAFPNPYAAIASPQGEFVMSDVEDPRYRFGPHNVVHADVLEARAQAMQAMSTPVSSTSHSTGQRTYINFSPDAVHSHVRRLAGLVLEAEGHVRGAGRSDGSFSRPGVYSMATVQAALRVHSNSGNTVFDSPKFQGESTTLYMPQTVTDSESERITHYFPHPDIGTLLTGVEKDQGDSQMLLDSARPAPVAAARKSRFSL